MYRTVPYPPPRTLDFSDCVTLDLSSESSPSRDATRSVSSPTSLFSAALQGECWVSSTIVHLSSVLA